MTNMKAGVTRRPYNTSLAMSDQSHLLVDSVSGSLRVLDPASPASPGGLSSSPPPSQFDISKAISSLDPSGYSPKSDTSSSSTLPHTNSAPHNNSAPHQLHACPPYKGLFIIQVGHYTKQGLKLEQLVTCRSLEKVQVRSMLQV